MHKLLCDFCTAKKTYASGQGGQQMMQQSAPHPQAQSMRQNVIFSSGDSEGLWVLSPSAWPVHEASTNTAAHFLLLVKLCTATRAVFALKPVLRLYVHLAVCWCGVK